MLEEAPSPAVEPGLRAQMGEAALRLAGAVGYVGAGTCEFLLDDRGAFTFLEMNTRLQVEHPVTELVTGRDLVADQLRIAAGEPLGIAQGDVTLDGHAVEVRLYAEDAEAGFLPATGRIERLRWPGGEGVRVDAGVAEGDVVGGRFDPMLAKIIARGRDRADALDRLTRALDETVVLGLTTNLRFLRWLVREPVVRDGEARTDTLDRIWPPDDWAARGTASRTRPGRPPRRRCSPATRAGAAASASTPRRRPAWRPTTRPGPSDSRPAATRRRGDRPGEAVRAGEVVHLDLAGRSTAFRLAPPPDVDRAASAAAAAHGSGRMELRAPMPGQVLSIGAGVGATGRGRRCRRDPRGHEDGARGGGARRPAASTRSSSAVGDQVQRGQVLAVVEPG